jgi:hypothetical protein
MPSWRRGWQLHCTAQHHIQRLAAASNVTRAPCLCCPCLTPVPPLQRYINSLRQAEAELEALLPAGQRQHKGSLGEGTRSDTEGRGGEEGDEMDEEGEGLGDAAAADEPEGAWAEGAIKVG